MSDRKVEVKENSKLNSKQARVKGEGSRVVQNSTHTQTETYICTHNITVPVKFNFLLLPKRPEGGLN